MELTPCTASLIGCGGTQSFAGLLVARFFQGVGGCKFVYGYTIQTLISDMH